MEGKTQETAAAKAGICVRSARNWQSGPLPSETKQERQWRTRSDPFEGVWEEEIEPLLQGEAAGKLKATTIIEWLEEQHPSRFSASQLRTLQRRLQDWRALHGPDQEVYFPQEHPPGREAQFDFTHGSSLGVTVAGRPYRHQLFQLILSHSGWRYAELANGETFLALQQGLQAALWTLGGVPQVVRSDNTSAATHEMRRSGGRALNDNYAALLEHYGLRSTRINPGPSHGNGVAEQGHYRLKDAIGQVLMLRGSRDFDTVSNYADFVRQMVARRNRLAKGKLEQEMPYLRPLPPAPMPEYANYQARVRKWSTVQVAGRTYSVPSRLIGKELRIRLYADWVEVYYKGSLVERLERVHGEREANVNYRHVIGSLVRKPGAFARYRFREQLFPTRHFRLAYDALKRWRGERADVEYVRILHLAATTGDHHGGHGGQRPFPAAGNWGVLRLRGGAGAGRTQGARSASADPVRPARPESLRPAADGQPGHGGGVRMTNTSVMQERIGQLCHQFKLPTMGTQSVARFTAAGHGDALSTFLEVLEQEADDRRQRRIDRLRKVSRLPSGKTWETFEHDRMPPCPCGSSWTNWPTATSPNTASTCWPSVSLAPARPTRCAPWATAWWRSATPSSSLQPTAWCRNYSPPSENWLCPGSCANWTTLTSCSSTTWATCPRVPRSPRSFSPSSPNATNADRWESPPIWSSRSGSASSPTPWPPPRRLTGWSTTASSWSLMSPATGQVWLNSGVRNRR